MSADGDPPEFSLPSTQQENVTAVEYQKALENLRRFATLDVEQIRNLNDLVVRMQGVGKAIEAVLVSDGEFHEVKFPFEHPKTEQTVIGVYRYYGFDEVLASGRRIKLRSNSSLLQQAGIEEYEIDEAGEKRNLLSVDIPYDDIDKRSDPRGMEIKAIDKRAVPPLPSPEQEHWMDDEQYEQYRQFLADERGDNKNIKVFIPTDHPTDESVQQGYANLLQEGVRDLLTVTPEATTDS